MEVGLYTRHKIPEVIFFKLCIKHGIFNEPDNIHRENYTKTMQVTKS